MTFSILTVCTGNIFRSPAAQYLLARELGGDPSVRVASAGTAAVLGHGVAETMDGFLRRDGMDPGSHRARALTMQLVREADVVIGLTRAHRARAISLWPDAHGRCFTLNELARLAVGVSQEELAARAAGPGYGERFAALVELLGARREAGSAADDIADPVGQAPEVVEAAYGQIAEAVDVIARVVRGTRRRPRPGH